MPCYQYWGAVNMTQGPTPFSLSKLFTRLLGRKVAFAQATDSPNKGVKQIYSVYSVFPDKYATYEYATVVKADLPLLGSFAGALLGLPDAAVKTRVQVSPLEELLRDAIYEIFNIASEEMTTRGRATLSKMETDPVYLSPAAASALRQPGQKSFFNVTVDGYQGGKFAIYVQNQGD